MGKRGQQGQRTLSLLPRKDFHHEVEVPAAHPPFHHETRFAGMLFDQRQRETPEPREILRKVTVACPLRVFPVCPVRTGGDFCS